MIMADYNVNFSQPQGAGAQALAPVQGQFSPPPSNLTPIVDAAKLFMAWSANQKEQEKLDQHTAIMRSYGQEQQNILDAVEQGSMDRSKAAVLQRTIAAKYLTQNPALVKDLQEANKAYLTTTELGEFQKDEQTTRDLEKEVDKNALAKGYPLFPSMSAESREQMRSTYLLSERTENDFKKFAERKRLSMSMAEEDRKLEEFNLKRQTQAKLSELGGSHMEAAVAWVGDLDKITDPAQRSLMVTSYFTMLSTNIAKIAETSPELASNWNKIVTDLRKDADEMATGKPKSNALEQRLKDAKNRAQLMAIENDPEVQAAYASSALLGPGVVTAQPNVNSASMKIFAKFTQYDGFKAGQVVGTKEQTFVFDGIKAGIKAAQNEVEQNPEVKNQVKTGINNTLTQLGKSIALGIKPADQKAAFDFLASPEFAQANKMGLVDPAQTATVKQVFQAQYEKDVSGAVFNKFNKSFDGNRTYGDVVSFEFAGDGIVIKPLDRYMTAEKAMERERLISETQPAIQMTNQLIKAGAHLEGHQNYAKYWEENKHRILPEYFQEDGTAKRTIGNDTGIQPIKQVVPKEQLVANKTTIGKYKYIGGDPDFEASWQLMK